MIKIDARSSTPLYEQIEIEIKELILNGGIKAGEKLPSIRELSSMVTINPNTVRKAYSELEREGVIETLIGRGTFIVRNYEPVFLESKYNEMKSKFRMSILEGKYLGLTKQEILNTFAECLAFVDGGI